MKWVLMRGNNILLIALCDLLQDLLRSNSIVCTNKQLFAGRPEYCEGFFIMCGGQSSILGAIEIVAKSHVDFHIRLIKAASPPPPFAVSLSSAFCVRETNCGSVVAYSCQACQFPVMRRSDFWERSYLSSISLFRWECQNLGWSFLGARLVALSLSGPFETTSRWGNSRWIWRSRGVPGRRPSIRPTSSETSIWIYAPVMLET